jgi:hypothetical protein
VRIPINNKYFTPFFTFLLARASMVFYILADQKGASLLSIATFQFAAKASQGLQVLPKSGSSAS